MAKVERVEFVDDVDGKPIDVGDLNQVEFELKLPGRRAARYTLDLRSTNLAKFEKDLQKYVSRATKVQAGGSAAGKTASGTTAPKNRNRAVREWAIENGYDISARGRVPATIAQAFDDVH